MEREKAVVLLSGGMDSLVTLAIACQENKVSLLHINYGQRTEKKEAEAFNRIAQYYHISDKLEIDLKHFSLIGGSALTDQKIAVPPELNDKGIPVTYVPFRNANLLAAAVSWAEVTGARKIYIGATEEDSAGYPDCRKEFFQAFQEVIRKGTAKQDINIITPLIAMTKSEIVKTGMDLQAPFQLSWSCYQAEETPCLVCDSCLRRIQAFKTAGYPDPILL